MDYDDPDELEALRKRAQDKLDADQMVANDSPNGTLGMRLATGGLDVLNRANNNSLAVASTISGRNLASPNGPTNAQDKYLAEMKSRSTLARQKALDDQTSIGTIQKLIDAKTARDTAATNRDQDLFAKGYKVNDDDDSMSLIPGGAAAVDMQDKASQRRLRDAQADWYSGGKGGGGKGGVNVDKMAKAFGKDLDPNQARGGQLAKSQAMINSADRVDALFQQFPDYNIPPGQTGELSSAIAGLINGGSAQSQHQIDMLTPQSLRGDAQRIAGWVTNEPTGMEQQQFMKMMHESALRERNVAQSQVRTAQIQRLPTHKAYMAADPEGYQAQLKAYGIDPSEIVDGRYAPKPKSPAGAAIQAHPQDSDAVAWAKANMDKPQAAAILKANGL